MRGHIGGVEKTLIEWIKTISPERFEIHLYLINLEGELIEEIPDYVKFIQIPDLSNILNGSFRRRISYFANKQSICSAIDDKVQLIAQIQK